MVKKKSRASNRTIRTIKKKDAVIKELGAGGTYTSAAKKAGIGRTTLYAWMKDDQDFNDACMAAEDEGTDILEQEAMRRAAKGVLEPIYHKGEQVGTVRKYSDTLLIFLLKGRRPEKFKDHVQHNVKGKIDHEHTHEVKQSMDFDAIRQRRDEVKKSVH
jgi:hypothetical protein